MKKFKKIFAVILSLAMVLGMSLTAFAATNESATGSASDKVEVKITELSASQNVVLYQIAEAQYQGSGAGAFVKYVWAEGIDDSIQNKAKDGLSSTDITAIVNGLKKNKDDAGYIKAINIYEGTSGATYTKEVSAGAYIAVITGASDGYIYNPILLTATYNGAGQLVGGEIAADTAVYGTEAVAKRTKADVNKELTSGTTEDVTIPDGANEHSSKHTASVGDVLGYTITPTVPSYPANAVNKTLFVSDQMSAGLDFDASSLRINIDDESVAADDNGKFIFNEKQIASVDTASVENGFYLNFTYDNILTADNVPYSPITVTYNARVNENAVVGVPGNENDAKMYYANDPTTGTTFEPTEDEKTPDGAEGVTKEEDKEIVYTYQVSFLKTKEDGTALAGAIFGIYKDEACKELVDVVTTNEAGYAVSTSVAAGTYYIKEIQAPTGYSLNDKVYEVKAVWTSATETINRSEATTKYTTEKDEAISDVVVGSIKDGKFYNVMDLEGSQPAYILSRTETKESDTIPTTNPAISGTVVLGENIPNTQMSTLPSTGGIGTTLFTIGGCIIMVIAAGLFFASRKKSAK